MKFNATSAFLGVFISLLSYTSIYAQVGINNDSPDSSSTLDMSGGTNIDKGILLPTTRDVINVNQPAHGLLIYNDSINEFFFRNDSSNTWQSLNRLRSNATERSSYILDSLGVGKTTPNANLDVAGNTNMDGGLAVGSDITVGGGITVNGLPGITSTGPVNATGKFATIKEQGFDLVPRGSIIMWNGNTPPNGWAICDGTTHAAVDGSGTMVVTPDLRGRFIVGKSNTDGTNYTYFNDEKNKFEYNTAGKIGGAADVALNTGNLPSHTHTFSGNTNTDGSHSHTYQVHGAGGANGTNMENADGGTPNQVNQGAANNKIWAGVHSHAFSGTTNATGSGNTHENTPPYFVLAFIMKL